MVLKPEPERGLADVSASENHVWPLITLLHKGICLLKTLEKRFEKFNFVFL